MPAVIKMRLSNGNPTFQQIAANSKAHLAPVPTSLPTNKNTALNSSSMINRIHNVKPGCGSCGRH
jgi:hypothetical protein